VFSVLFSEQSVIFVMACQVVKIMHNARKLERKERTEEGRTFVNIFLLAIYKLGIALEENVTFFTSAKSEKYKPSTA